MPGHVRKNIVAILPVVILLIMISGGCGTQGNNPVDEKKTFSADFRETAGPQNGGMNYTFHEGETGITPALDPEYTLIYDRAKLPDTSSDSIEFWISVPSPLKKKTYIIDSNAVVTINDAQRALYGALECAGTLEITNITATRAAGNFNFHSTAIGIPNDTLYVAGSFDLPYH
ncbi:MAG TPA: hypothetical protein VFJ29_07520 [Candidatus Kapabacteria bacterium]|nr:hypothetical protein [Candidatus Kapabacteria bacterium]